ncbi:extracellular solute-binding protein [Paenibacillus solisilvae]|uniref:Extracellular solute-binding protein n=1 Tax=Paenibacillus solisilvae TaxID=2486751 RepID=A0ABW0W547_9BACL
MVKRRRTLAATVVLVSVIATTGCQSQGNKVDSTAKLDLSKPAENYSLPIVTDGSVTLTFSGNDNYYAPRSFSQNLPVWAQIEKKTGVKIKWDVTPSSQYQQVIKVRLAAAQDLPDIITIPDQFPTKLASDGLIIPLDGLIDKYAPNIKKYLQENPDLYKYMQAPDGKIYAISADVTGAAYADPNGLIIRQDWLDKLGLTEPKTLDEWYTVLKAFKEKDPNGNGKPDEIPYSPNYNLDGINVFGSALGLHLFYSFGYFPDENGKIQYEWMDPRAEKLIVWLNKIYKEGLLDPQFLKNTDSDIFSNISRNLVGSTNHFINNVNRYNVAQQNAGIKDVNWQLTLPPENPGYKGFYEKYGPMSGWWGISKDSKNPEVAIKWLDYIYASEEGSTALAYGIEGQSYTIQNGQPEFTDWVVHNPDGLSFNEALRYLGAMPTTPWIRNAKGPLYQQAAAILRKDPKLEEMAKKVESYLTDPVPLSMPSLDEIQQVSSIQTDIDTYMEETLSKFITGQEEIDWAKFVSTLKSMGIDEIIKTKQAQYDRMTK